MTCSQVKETHTSPSSSWLHLAQIRAGRINPTNNKHFYNNFAFPEDEHLEEAPSNHTLPPEHLPCCSSKTKPAPFGYVPRSKVWAQGNKTGSRGSPTRAISTHLSTPESPESKEHRSSLHTLPHQNSSQQPHQVRAGARMLSVFCRAWRHRFSDKGRGPEPNPVGYSISSLSPAAPITTPPAGCRRSGGTAALLADAVPQPRAQVLWQRHSIKSFMLTCMHHHEDCKADVALTLQSAHPAWFHAPVPCLQIPASAALTSSLGLQVKVQQSQLPRLLLL